MLKKRLSYGMCLCAPMYFYVLQCSVVCYVVRTLECDFLENTSSPQHRHFKSTSFEMIEFQTFLLSELLHDLIFMSSTTHWTNP